MAESDAKGTFTYSCAVCDGDYGVSAACSDTMCNAHDSLASKCSASYYNPTAGGELWGANSTELKNKLCISVGAGNWSGSGATAPTQCPAGYRDGPAATSQSGCYMNVPAGKYVKTANDSSASTCSAGYWNPAHTVYYGKTSNCNRCTGATYSDTAGASSCKQCPTATEYAGIVQQYSYWSEDGIQDNLSECRIYFVDTSDEKGTFKYYSCSYCDGDYGVSDKCGDACNAYEPLASICNASYYNPNLEGEQWGKTFEELKSNLCVSVGVGNWSGSGATAPTQCPSGYRDGPAATSQSGCAKNCTNQSIAGGTNVPVSSTVNYPNSCEYTTVCNDGYNQSSDGVCSQLCVLGFTTLRTGSGLVIPLYSEKLSSPAIHIGYNGGMCYGILESGSGEGINLEYNGQTYHTGK